jgi:hypothetical protein
MDAFIQIFCNLSLGAYGVVLDGIGAILLGMAFFLQTPADVKRTALIFADWIKIKSSAEMVCDGRVGTFYLFSGFVMQFSGAVYSDQGSSASGIGWFLSVLGVTFFLLYLTCFRKLMVDRLIESANQVDLGAENT